MIESFFHSDRVVYKTKTKTKIFSSTPAGFEPARAQPNRFLIYRLNHSATVSVPTYCYCSKHTKIIFFKEFTKI